jgi:hypothetical protein
MIKSNHVVKISRKLCEKYSTENALIAGILLYYAKYKEEVILEKNLFKELNVSLYSLDKNIKLLEKDKLVKVINFKGKNIEYKLTEEEDNKIIGRSGYLATNIENIIRLSPDGAVCYAGLLYNANKNTDNIVNFTMSYAFDKFSINRKRYKKTISILESAGLILPLRKNNRESYKAKVSVKEIEELTNYLVEKNFYHTYNKKISCTFLDLESEKKGVIIRAKEQLKRTQNLPFIFKKEHTNSKKVQHYITLQQRDIKDLILLSPALRAIFLFFINLLIPKKEKENKFLGINLKLINLENFKNLEIFNKVAQRYKNVSDLNNLKLSVVIGINDDIDEEILHFEEISFLEMFEMIPNKTKDTLIEINQRKTEINRKSNKNESKIIMSLLQGLYDNYDVIKKPGEVLGINRLHKLVIDDCKNIIKRYGDENYIAFFEDRVYLILESTKDFEYPELTEYLYTTSYGDFYRYSKVTGMDRIDFVILIPTNTQEFLKELDYQENFSYIISGYDANKEFKKNVKILLDKYLNIEYNIANNMSEIQEIAKSDIMALANYFKITAELMDLNPQSCFDEDFDTLGDLLEITTSKQLKLKIDEFLRQKEPMPSIKDLKKFKGELSEYKHLSAASSL